MPKDISVERSRLGPRQVGRMTMSREETAQYNALRDIGINIDMSTVRQMMTGLGMDGVDLTPQLGMTVPSVTTPIQFLQNWLPGIVHSLTAARKIDDLVGISTTGSWEDQSVVQGLMELLGEAVYYSDYGNIPLSSYNMEWAERDIVRFEKGMQVGALEEARGARTKVNVAAAKRAAATNALDIARNRIGFLGFNAGNNKTYGFLNDPSLLAYNTVPNGAKASPLWSQKTFLEITADLRLAASRLRVQGAGNIDPMKNPITLALPIGAVDYLTVTSDQGVSVRQWINENYPNWRIESAPELDGANGGASVFYLYAETVEDGASDDDNRAFIQIVPAKFQVLGVEKRAKSYVEDYTNATAGVLVKRPYAIVRYTGI